jgi:uncharacterized cupin superfamily protein
VSEIAIKKFDDVGYYEGPNSIPGIKFRHAARDLGVTAWGMNILEIEPGCTGYPQHDHASEGQEEVYVVLRGSALLEAEGQKWPLETGTLVRVGPGVRRKLVPGADGLTVLAIGGTPGKAFSPRK